MALKIVVIGSVEGHFGAVFSKLATLQSKNAFSLAIVVGDLFAKNEAAVPADDEGLDVLLRGGFNIQIPTYFGLGGHKLPERVINKLLSSSGEVCENLFFLGRRSTITTSEGLRIVTLGGSLNQKVTFAKPQDAYAPFYNENDARALFGAKTADILITHEWPVNIRRGSKVSFGADNDEPSTSSSISELCSVLKPKYHFSSSVNAFLEREPFFHEVTDDGSSGNVVTRFISLASYGNSKNSKWIYAFSVNPNSVISEIPKGATPSPLAHKGKKRGHPDGQASHRFHFEDGAQHRHHKSKRRQNPSPSQCFFCLSNPNVASHLVVSIATDAYLTTAKGPLTTANHFPALPFPGHILVIPMSHSPTIMSIPDVDVRRSTYNDMQKYRRSLHKLVSATSNSDLGSVTWEISRSNNVHAHWQFLPLPKHLIDSGMLETAFQVEAENEGYPSFKRSNEDLLIESSGDYFKVVIASPAIDADEGGPDESRVREVGLTLFLDSSFRFDLQYGRKVLAKLLKLDERTDWHACQQSLEDEKADADAFKTAFKPFDFSLEE